MLVHFRSHDMQCKIRYENHLPGWLGEFWSEGVIACLRGRSQNFPQIEKIKN
jgi:hypothetical protein